MQERNKGAYDVALLKATLGADKANATGEQKAFDAEAKANKEIRTALDPQGMRAGNFGNFAKRLAVLNDLDVLIKQYPDPNEQQWYEIARTFDNAISMGAATVSGTKHLVPSTLLGDANKMANYAFNTAKGSGQGEHAKLYKEMIDRQRQYWGNEVSKVVKGRLGSLKPYMDRYPESTATTLESLASELEIPAGELMKHHPLGGRRGTPVDSGGGATPTVNSKSEFDALKKGDSYINGKTGKPEIKG
jgi:hypothetical protein